MRFRLAPWTFLLAAGVSVSLAAIARSAPAQAPVPPAAANAAYASDPSFQSALDQAREADDPPHGRFSHWKEASDLAANQCAECLHHLVEGEFAVHDWKEAARVSQLLDSFSIERNEKFFAEASAGKALLHDASGGEHPPAAQLEQAEGYLRSALSRSRSTSILQLDGEVLASLGKDDLAKAQFELFLRVAQETNSHRELVQSYAANPHLAAKYASSTTGAQDGPVPALPAGGGSPLALAARPPAAPEPAYRSDPKFQKAFAAAQERVPQDEKLARWKKANKLADNQCVECLRSIITLQMSEQQWKDAANSATQLDAIAVEKKDKFFAAAERGQALFQTNNNQPKPDQLREAEASLHTALGYSPRNGNLIYLEGRALAMQGRDDDAKAMFARYLEAVGEADKYRTRAEHFAANPHLATMPMAPPFTLTTSEGEQISLDEMTGKVVLLDFWATWCGPCKETLPEIHSIAKKFAGQPLVVVSISQDADDVAWKQFVAKNDMFWTQYRDSNHALGNAYGVTAIPRFFTIDSDGVLQSVKVGSGADIEGDLKKLVKRAAQDANRKAAATDKPAAE